MVAHLLKIRLLTLRNTLARSPLQLVGLILGGLWGLGMIATAIVAFGVLGGTARSGDLEPVRTWSVLAGSALFIGWIVVPIAAAGVDQTLDPSKLVVFPIPRVQLMIALALSAVIGIPGILTVLGSLATVVAWWAHPLGLLVAIVCAGIGVATCVFASRLVLSAASGFSSQRRFKELTGVIVYIPLFLLGPIVIWVTSVLVQSGGSLGEVSELLAWTPLGAIWSVPADVVAGAWGLAAARFGIAVASLAVIVALWWYSAGRAFENPASGSSSGGGAAKLGLLGRLPGTPAGAVAARSLIYWFRDPRYSRQLIMIVLIPALLAFYAFNPFGGTANPAMLVAAGPILGFVLATAIMIDVAYDGTAFAAHITSGLRGIDDRAGRALAAMAFAVPSVLLVTIGSVAVSGLWSILPGLLGLSLGPLLAGYGISSVASARVVYPVPAPGDNAFKSPPGAGVPAALSSFAVLGVSFLLSIPVLVLAIVSFATGSLVWGLIALVVGVAVGVAVLITGIRMGGRLIDRRAPELFEQLVAQS